MRDIRLGVDDDSTRQDGTLSVTKGTRLGTRKRRKQGTGSIFWDAAAGSWTASIRTKDGRRIKRRAPDYPEAKHQLATLIREFRSYLGPAYRPWRRRDLERQSIRPSLRFAILTRDGYRCTYCGATAKEARLHVDHVVSVRDGGTDDESNLVTACRECNLGKGAA